MERLPAEKVEWDKMRDMLIDETREAVTEVAKEILPKPSQHETQVKKEAHQTKAKEKMNKLVDSVWEEYVVETGEV